jgi:hypothetical protein
MAATCAAVITGCTRHAADGAPEAEFIIAAGDSSYWARSGDGVLRVRGSPLVLARLNGRFLELYVVDDDRSFEDALFVGQRLYQRDLITGDSTEIFRDTVVSGLADSYERKNPDARRLAPDEDPAEEPSMSASAEVSVLGVHGPFLSLEYHVDTAGAGDEAWHMTRHVVVDLRNGKQSSVADVIGGEQAPSVIARARKLYQETVDSVRRDSRPTAQRAARSLNRFRFDPASFSLVAPNGTLMIAFSAPGQGEGGEGFVLPVRPIPVTEAEPAWWTDARSALPSSTKEREEHWSRGSYTVKATYDSSLSRPVRVTLLDSAGKEFTVGNVTAPVHRIYWLDRPPIDRTVRNALTRAFDEAALYDESARTAHGAAWTPEYFLAARR